MALTTPDPNTALVLVDLQRGIVASPAVPNSGAEVVTRCAELAQAFRKRELPVVLVNVNFGADFAAAPKGRKEIGPAAGFRPPADWSDLVDGIDAQPGDIRVRCPARTGSAAGRRNTGTAVGFSPGKTVSEGAATR
ncbi:isochorismatase family protein [Nocardia sp. IFM 10818]